MGALVVGMKVRYLPQPEWGTGHLLKLDDQGARAEVLFPGRGDEPVIVSTRGGHLQGVALKPGEAMVTVKGRACTIEREEEGARGLRRYVLRYDDGEEDELPETELRGVRPKPDLLSQLRIGRVGEVGGFLLRKQALLLDDERRNDALGALFASRVMVKPHQVGVVQRVLSARRPRFILADEVGLGKTIEAGMIFSALRLAGLARRVLVVTPSHLSVQWLGELFHKFNQLFTLLDGDRYAASLKEVPDQSPWARFDKVVTSLELLSRTDEHRAQASAKEAAWDLVIIDEAHHLKSDRAFEVARSLAQNSWGLLLLTATPMQLDPAEYHRLLTLVDPDSAPTLEGLQSRLEKQEEISKAVRALLDGKGPKALETLKGLFPDDELLRKKLSNDALLEHLAESYSLSDLLVRNRRAVVGGFSERRLRRHAVRPSAQELEAREKVLATLREEGGLSGAPLASLLRRLDSSPAAFLEAVSGTKALAEIAPSLQLPRADAKLAAFLELLNEIWRAEPQAKLLVFTEARATLDALVQRLSAANIEALGYHGDLGLVERDRLVGRFRDPEGPKILVCTEVGGEGRNFQFSHHLINYDLPWSPATMEQRIGRLDRIGQTRPVELHVFDVEGTVAHDVLQLLADAVGVFEQTVGGLDAVLEEVEPKLLELALLQPKDRERYATELGKKVAQARAQVQRAYDPLLDLRSFDQKRVQALIERAAARMSLDDELADGSVEDGLWAIARDLDERLEEAVTELGLRVGLGVDTEEQVDAFQCAFHFGHALNVEALPGLDISRERTHLGTFWRDTAVEQEEIEYFATGHPLVEALFGFLRDGPFGRSAFRALDVRGPHKARGLEVLFHLVPPEPQDTSPGARVPSRQLSRFLERSLVHVVVAQDESGAAVEAPKLLPMLEGEGRGLRGDQVMSAFPEFGEFVDPAITVATAAAEKERVALCKRAAKALGDERDRALLRLRRALGHQGLAADAIEAQLEAERAHYTRLEEALAKVRVELDSAAGFIINRGR